METVISCEVSYCTRPIVPPKIHRKLTIITQYTACTYLVFYLSRKLRRQAQWNFHKRDTFTVQKTGLSIKKPHVLSPHSCTEDLAHFPPDHIPKMSVVGVIHKRDHNSSDHVAREGQEWEGEVHALILSGHSPDAAVSDLHDDKRGEGKGEEDGGEDSSAAVKDAGGCDGGGGSGQRVHLFPVQEEGFHKRMKKNLSVFGKGKR